MALCNDVTRGVAAWRRAAMAVVGAGAVGRLCPGLAAPGASATSVRNAWL